MNICLHGLLFDQPVNIDMHVDKNHVMYDIRLALISQLGFFKRKKITPEEKEQIRENIRQSMYYEETPAGE